MEGRKKSVWCQTFSIQFSVSSIRNPALTQHTHTAKNSVHCIYLSYIHTFTHDTKYLSCALKVTTHAQPFQSILTGRKGVLSLQCPLSSPKGVLALNCLPLSLRLCGPRLRRPAVNRQNVKLEGWQTNCEGRTHGGHQTQVTALLYLHNTTSSTAGVHISFSNMTFNGESI